MPTISKPKPGAKNPIDITSQDKQRFDDLLAEVELSNRRAWGDLVALKHELK
jgi:hypothetical protein